MISSLFELLYRFLDRGPSFLGPQHQRRINVEEIVLNVVDWPEEVLARAEQENTLDRAHAERALRGREHSNHKPADVMLKIRNKIDAVEGSPKYPVSCRDAIDGRLGRIRLLLGGKEISMANFK